MIRRAIVAPLGTKTHSRFPGFAQKYNIAANGQKRILPNGKNQQRVQTGNNVVFGECKIYMF